MAELLRMSGDTNSDGAIVLSEIYDLIRRDQRLPDDMRQIPFAMDVLAMDINGDGQTVPEEIGRVVAAIGKLAETRGMPVADLPQRAPSLLCDPPKPEDGVEVVVITGYEGGALSNVAVAGQGTEVTASRLVIEPGETPLYIFATAFEAMVWQVEGATERVQRFVVQPRSSNAGPGAGVTGLAKDKVVFVPAGACLKPFHEAGDLDGKWQTKAFGKVIGHEVGRIIADYTLSIIAVPSGEKVVEPKPPRKPTLDENGAPVFVVDMMSPENLMSRFHPLGLLRSDPKSVVAPSEVQPFEVLPQEAGLGQLLQEGALEPAAGDLGGRGNAFYIRKPIKRFPAGLGGAHAVTFILGKGVPMPGGDPGHSIVLDEETGACLLSGTKRC
ncbi:MAG: hypothetical protein ACRCS0_05820 [Albidovulum sp.]